jgi:hypothetical protein
MPKLVDLMSTLASADPESTIYVVEPIGPYSEVTVCAEPEEGGEPSGHAYLLEVSLARDVLRVWTSWRDGRRPTAEQAARAVIYYAQHDAYEPV